MTFPDVHFSSESGQTRVRASHSFGQEQIELSVLVPLSEHATVHQMQEQAVRRAIALLSKLVPEAL